VTQQIRGDAVDTLRKSFFFNYLSCISSACAFLMQTAEYPTAEQQKFKLGLILDQMVLKRVTQWTRGDAVDTLRKSSLSFNCLSCIPLCVSSVFPLCIPRVTILRVSSAPQRILRATH
jgi:hypothetical protein